VRNTLLSSTTTTQNVTAYSDWQKFCVPSAPNQPQLLSPTGNTRVSSTSTSLQWNSLSSFGFTYTYPDVTSQLLFQAGFEETSGNTVLSSVGGYVGTIYNANSVRSQQNVAGVIGQALRLNGTQSVAFPNFTPPNAGTITLWVRLLQNFYAYNYGNTYYMFQCGGGFLGYVQNGNGDSGFQVHGTNMQSGSTGYPLFLPPNVWVHLAYTYDLVAGTGALYADGFQIATTTTTDNVTAVCQLTLGSNVGQNTHFLEADFDDFRVYGTALSSSQIQQIAFVQVPQEVNCAGSPFGFSFSLSCPAGQVMEPVTASALNGGYGGNGFCGTLSTNTCGSPVTAASSCGNEQNCTLFANTTSFNPIPNTSTSQLVGWWKFEDSGAKGIITDSSGNGHRGTLMNSSWVSGGILFLNGVNSYVDLGTTIDIHSSTLSITSWVMPYNNNEWGRVSSHDRHHLRARSPSPFVPFSRF